MKIVIIGSGNVATVLGRKIKNAGHHVLQVYSRNLIHATQLASGLNCSPTDDWNTIDPEAEIYLIALQDGAIAEAAKMLVHKGLMLHTAGAVSKEILKTCSANYGVLYPLQSLRKEKKDYQNIPLLIDGNTVDNLTLIEEFAHSISASVQKANDEYRLKLHLGAVFVNNFTNHLYSLTATYCQKENISFKLLKPLIEETATRLQNYDPRLVQTGPAIRNDQETIEKHLQLLVDHPQLKYIYEIMTMSIQQKQSL